MINKTLFNTLCCFTKQYKQPLPEVKNENQPIVWKDMIQFDKTGTPYKSKQVIDSGEEYVLNCPFCGDTRHRFYINHMWGTKDDSSGSLNLWLMHCYNENCEENIENQHNLLYMLYGPSYRALRIEDICKDYSKLNTNSNCDYLHTIQLPENCTRLDQLPMDHLAVSYMTSRGYDVYELASRYNFMYCNYSTQPFVSKRIIMPVYCNNICVGWQARLIGNIDKTANNGTYIPKYYTSKGFKTSQWAFNLDNASKYKTIVITEGILDAINTGDFAIGVFGKSVSEIVKTKVIAAARKNRGSVVIMLDPTLASVGQEHQIERAARQFSGCGVPISKVYLPEGTDPGSFPREEIKKIITQQSKNQFVDINFEFA